MGKISEFLRQKLPVLKSHIPELMFLLFSTRLICLGANFGDSLALVSLASVLGYKMFLSKTRADTSEELVKQVDSMKNVMQALQIDKIRSVKGSNASDEKKRYF